MTDSKADAALYLLTCLIQKLEKTQPSLIQDLITGIKADQTATPAITSEKNSIDAIFKESLVVLERIQDLSKNLHKQNNA